MKPEDIADIVREHLTAAYVCNRTWSAWSYNTMSQDDFVEASETEMADEIAAAIVKRYGQPAQPAASAEHFAEVVGGGMVFWRCGTPPDGTKLYTAPVAAQPSVPEGWKLVPIEPTPEMRDAITSGIRHDHMVKVYQDMLEAAPTPSAVNQAQQPGQDAEPCKTCGDTGVVDDGEINCYESGEPYMNGPVKCVKDCPDCTAPKQPSVPDTVYLGCARMGLAGASDEEVLNYVRMATRGKA